MCTILRFAGKFINLCNHYYFVTQCVNCAVHNQHSISIGHCVRISLFALTRPLCYCWCAPILHCDGAKVPLQLIALIVATTLPHSTRRVDDMPLHTYKHKLGMFISSWIMSKRKQHELSIVGETSTIIPYHRPYIIRRALWFWLFNAQNAHVQRSVPFWVGKYLPGRPSTCMPICMTNFIMHGSLLNICVWYPCSSN